MSKDQHACIKHVQPVMELDVKSMAAIASMH